MAEHKLIRIGRSEGQNDIVINHPSVSRVHCELFYDGDGNAFLTDLDSANGTYVNGKRVREPVLLKNTDIVKLGFGNPIPWKEYIDEPLNAVDSDVELELQASDSGTHHFVPVKKANPVLVTVVMVATVGIVAALVFALNSCGMAPKRANTMHTCYPLNALNSTNVETQFTHEHLIRQDSYNSSHFGSMNAMRRIQENTMLDCILS